MDQEQIKKLKEILNGVKYVSMATVNKDGSPHNSPLVFLYDEKLHYIYWGSNPESQHSQNILRTGQAFFVAFNGTNSNIGVYISANKGKIAEGNDLITALKVHNYFRAKMGKKPIDIFYYSDSETQKMWMAEVNQIWINAYERDKNGTLIRDYKIEIKPETLSDLWN
jgi:general stress protein 26